MTIDVGELWQLNKNQGNPSGDWTFQTPGGDFATLKPLTGILIISKEETYYSHVFEAMADTGEIVIFETNEILGFANKVIETVQD